MKLLLPVLLLLSLNALSQDSSFTRTYACRCDSLIHRPALQNLMKGKGVNCDINAAGIFSNDFHDITSNNTSKAIIDAYANIRLQFKLHITCNNNGLKVQLLFKEGRPGTTVWINTLTEKGKAFAQRVFDEWLPQITKTACLP
jgi:hypothetical protein